MTLPVEPGASGGLGSQAINQHWSSVKPTSHTHTSPYSLFYIRPLFSVHQLTITPSTNTKLFYHVTLTMYHDKVLVKRLLYN